MRSEYEDEKNEGLYFCSECEQYTEFSECQECLAELESEIRERERESDWLNSQK